MSWLLDQANVFYFLLGSVALGFFVYGWLTRRPRYWAYGGACVALIALLWLAGELIITDRRQIVINLDAMRQAAIEKNASELKRHFSRDLRFGNEPSELAQRIVAAVKEHKVKDAFIWDQAVKVEGDKGEVFFNFRADAEAGGTYFASAKCRFVKEDGAWKLRQVEVYKINSTERQWVPGVD